MTQTLIDFDANGQPVYADFGDQDSPLIEYVDDPADADEDEALRLTGGTLI